MPPSQVRMVSRDRKCLRKMDVTWSEPDAPMPGRAITIVDEVVQGEDVDTAASVTLKQGELGTVTGVNPDGSVVAVFAVTGGNLKEKAARAAGRSDKTHAVRLAAETHRQVLFGGLSGSSATRWSSWTDPTCGGYDATFVLPHGATEVTLCFDVFGGREVRTWLRSSIGKDGEREQPSPWAAGWAAPASQEVFTFREGVPVDAVFELEGPSLHCAVVRAWNAGQRDGSLKEPWEWWEPLEEWPAPRAAPRTTIAADCAEAPVPRPACVADVAATAAAMARRWRAAAAELLDVQRRLLNGEGDPPSDSPPPEKSPKRDMGSKSEVAARAAGLEQLADRNKTQHRSANALGSLSAGLAVASVATIELPPVALALGLCSLGTRLARDAGDKSADALKRGGMAALVNEHKWELQGFLDVCDERDAWVKAAASHLPGSIWLASGEVVGPDGDRPVQDVDTSARKELTMCARVAGVSMVAADDAAAGAAAAIRAFGTVGRVVGVFGAVFAVGFNAYEWRAQKPAHAIIANKVTELMHSNTLLEESLGIEHGDESPHHTPLRNRGSHRDHHEDDAEGGATPRRGGSPRRSPQSPRRGGSTPPPDAGAAAGTAERDLPVGSEVKVHSLVKMAHLNDVRGKVLSHRKEPDGVTDQILVTLPRKGTEAVPFLNFPAPTQTIPFRAANLRMVHHPDELLLQRQRAERAAMTPPRTPSREAPGAALRADPMHMAGAPGRAADGPDGTPAAAGGDPSPATDAAGGGRESPRGGDAPAGGGGEGAAPPAAAAAAAAAAVAQSDSATAAEVAEEATGGGEGGAAAPPPSAAAEEQKGGGSGDPSPSSPARFSPTSDQPAGEAGDVADA